MGHFRGYACGANSDLKVARQFLFDFFDPSEKVVADKGHNNTKRFIIPSEANNQCHRKIKRRHETVNNRIRHFNILQHTFRHVDFSRKLFSCRS